MFSGGKRWPFLLLVVVVLWCHGCSLGRVLVTLRRIQESIRSSVICDGIHSHALTGNIAHIVSIDKFQNSAKKKALAMTMETPDRPSSSLSDGQPDPPLTNGQEGDTNENANQEQAKDVPTFAVAREQSRTNRRTRKHTSFFNIAKGSLVLLVCGCLFFLAFFVEDDEDFSESSYTIIKSSQTFVSCESILAGHSWTAWVERQNSRPQDKRCGPTTEHPMNCQCGNPMNPWDKSSESDWKLAFNRNKAMVQMARNDQRSLDIVFLGDSITEHWIGADTGEMMDEYKGIKKVFETSFRDPSAPLRGLALGIGGDRTTNLLYRINEGELPDHISPRIFWILIGTNDFGAENCSIDMVTAAIVWIAETVLRKKRNSTVVLNSILPRGAGIITENPIMRQVQGVNQRLACYAEVTDQVYFFNATNYFMTSDGRLVDTNLMPDALHPNEAGSEKWASGITRFALDLTWQNSNDPNIRRWKRTAK